MQGHLDKIAANRLRASKSTTDRRFTQQLHLGDAGCVVVELEGNGPAPETLVYIRRSEMARFALGNPRRDRFVVLILERQSQLKWACHVVDMYVILTFRLIFNRTCKHKGRYSVYSVYGVE